jgi:hypothetical protein
MDDNKPISGELAAMMPIISHTMEGAVQALRQSNALAAVLIEKGILTKAELDAAMKPTDELTKTLRKALGDAGKESS